MSRRHDIERRLHNLAEIGEIMNAMKNMALMETHKLTGRLPAQQRCAASVDAAVQEFLAFHPQVLGEEGAAHHVCLVIGSERGFCGDYNEALLRALAQQRWPGGDPDIVAVGRRLVAGLDRDPRLVARIEGAGTLEQVEGVLLNVMDALTGSREARAPGGTMRATVLHHAAEEPGVVVTPLDPRSRARGARAGRGHAPLLNLEPRIYFEKLAEHYLLSALHTIFYGSLMAENRRRAQHMDEAVRHIGENSHDLALVRNCLRQEEITEEIEVIMLNVEAEQESYHVSRQQPTEESA